MKEFIYNFVRFILSPKYLYKYLEEFIIKITYHIFISCFNLYYYDSHNKLFFFQITFFFFYVERILIPINKLCDNLDQRVCKYCMGLNFSTSIFLRVIIKKFRLGETRPHVRSGRTTNNSSQNLYERRSKSHFSTSVFWISNKKHLIYLSNVFNYLKKTCFFLSKFKKNAIYNFFPIFVLGHV